MRNAKWIVFLSLAVVLAAHGCVTTEPQKPAEDAKTAQFKAMVPGTQFVVKVTKGKTTTDDKYIVTKETIEGQEVFVEKHEDGKVGHVYDPRSNNWMGEWNYEKGEYIRRAKPHSNQFEFPLFVGKKYSAV